MKTFLKSNWGKILLLILLIAISILSFKTGYSYLSNDNYSPDLNPLLTIQRSMQSPAWRSYRVLGFASESEQADIFRSTLYYVLDIFLPIWSLSQIFALLCFVIGSWFTALLTSHLVKDSKLAKYSELVFLLSGIFYVSTLWTVWVYYQNMFPYITQFGFLPLLVWSIYRLIKSFNWKNALIFFISSILFTSTFVIATLFVVDILVISFLVVVFAIFYSKTFKEVLKKSILTILLFISTQLFWILPFVHYTVNVSGDIVDSKINRSITSSVIDLESRDQDALNSAKLYTRTMLEEENDEYVFERADDYAKYDFFNVVGMIPAFFTLLLLIFSIIKKKWKYTILSVGAFVAWFIIKNVNPPLGSVFIWFQNNVPLFKQVFRWASSKVGNTYLLLLSISAPIGFIYLIDFLANFLKKPLKIFLYTISTLIIILPTLFYAQYLFTGKIYPQRALIQIPTEYFQVKEYIEEQEISESRVLYLPPANNNYFRTYDWGFWGSNFISYILPNPIMDLSSAIGSKYGEEAMLEIQGAFRAKDSWKLEEIINKYQIEYILVDKTLEEDGFTFSWDWQEVGHLWNDRELAYSTDDLNLYRTDITKNENLIESNSNESETFVYEDNSVKPIISTEPEIYDNWDIEEGVLVAEREYLGDELILSSELSENSVMKSPTLLRLDGNSIYLHPSIPAINKLNEENYKKYQYGGSDVVVIDKNVFTKTEIEDNNISIESEFGDNHSISTLNSSHFLFQNLTSILSSSTPYECVTGTREETTEVALQGAATGFDLKGNDGMPCIYLDLIISRDSDSVIEIDINWETTNESLLGYCIYSQNEEKCLNSERYFSADKSIGEIENILDQTVSKSNYISLIIYAINSQDSPEVTIRNVSLGYGLVDNSLNLIDQNISSYQDRVNISNGDTFKILIPIVRGENSYKLNSNTIWQPNIDESTFVLENNGEGIYQEVENGFANSSINLFNTQPISKYLLYWKGQNISNIPADLCIAYFDDNKCWIKDIFYADTTKSNLNIFTTDNRTGRFDLSMVSTSHNLTTKNLLQDIVVMEYPEIWEDFEYVPEHTNIKYIVEAETLGGSLSSTYVLEDSGENGMLTIPQASEEGWVAISLNNGIPSILKKRVVVNGWKQGWDISDIDYDSIYVIYYPNLLAYIGYLIWISVFVLIMVKLIKRKNER